MNAVLALYRTTIGKKLAMALSGVVYIGWVLFHMAGNLNFHLGPQVLNDYAHKLQDMPPVVWGGRTVLLVALIVHVASAFSLIAHNRSARKTAYKGPKKALATTSAALSMRYGGIALLLFIVWHIADLTVGVLSPVHQLTNLYSGASLGFIRGEVYHDMLVSFGSPISLSIYVVAVIGLSLHLYHGVWSAVQTLGFDQATTGVFWRRVAAFVAGLVLVGNLSYPISGFFYAVTGVGPEQVITGHGEKYYGARVTLPKATSAKTQGTP
jgi:succinate dehydrogenase / fumarate reductase cytochrome b subunit